MPQDIDQKGAWIFVSHSTKDIEEGRAVRNELERLGQYPLLFFLKCIEADEELDDLLKREIKARNFFILCDSPNAHASRWVQQEVAFIRSLAGKSYEVIDLASDWRIQLPLIERLSRKATLFLSYSADTHAEVRQLARDLRELDYRIFFDEAELAPGDDSRGRIQAVIDEALRFGLFLFFLTVSARQRRHSWQYAELSYALDRSRTLLPGMPSVIPIILGDPTLPTPELPTTLEDRVWVDLRHVQPERRSDYLHEKLTAITKRWTDV